MTQLAERRDSQAASVGFIDDFDVVLVSDMTRPGDIDLRIAREVRALADVGHRIGLIHVDSRDTGPRIGAEIGRCVRETKAEAIEPERTIAAKLLLVHAPSGLSLLQHRLRRVSADRFVVIADRLPDYDLAAKDRALSKLFGPVSWAPTNRWVRASLERLLPGHRIAAEDWRLLAGGVAGATPIGERPRTLGWIMAAGPGIPADTDAQAVPASDGAFRVSFLGRPPRWLISSEHADPTSWRVFEHGEVSVERYLAGVDLVACLPVAGVTELADATIATAMASGKPVVLASHLEPHYGPGPVYCAPADAPGLIRRLLGDPVEMAVAGEAVADVARERFSETAFRAGVADLVGQAGPPAAATAPAPRRDPRPAPRRAIFVAPDSDGPARLMPLLAIARRLGDLEPVFVTGSADAHVIESFGFVTEHLTPRHLAQGGASLKDAWHAAEFEQLVGAYAAGLVVFAAPLADASGARCLARRSDCRLALIASRSPGEGCERRIGASRYCDLVLEPGDLRADSDGQPPPSPWCEVLAIEPTRLTDESELLDRTAAAGALGLDPARPAMLVELGAGLNREVVKAAGEAMRAARAFPELQVAVHEGPFGIAEVSLWPEAIPMRGHPIGRYLRAFDFALAPADYATVHELIGCALPAILVADSHRTMADEPVRARLAEEAGVALELRQDNFHELGRMIRVLLDERARAHMRESCRRRVRGNGAEAAAHALSRLADQVASA